MIGKGEDYTTGSLLDFNYFDKHYKQGTNSTIDWVLEKSKETILEFYKGTVKVY